MTKWKVLSASPEETLDLGERLGKLLTGGTVITLEGDLGAGKTHFTKGIAKGLSIKRVVSSPTFTIIKEYMGRMPLYHIDAYRLEESEDDLGFDEYFYGEGVTVIEWASMIREQLPTEYLAITIQHDKGARLLTLTPRGERYDALCKEFLKDESISD
ncbi:MAG TPA: tRNA (adenosine(37)-N6)-threonylcarbamoyltransferase complex ATPase subunit type 1 TsaE [Bacilli bacterium]|nr:tRNA (adenosine(37)-N6)-threonylcarbamoyltransferase complex ATPase subunit type 1 TsaE [Bacilli bacterium]